MSLNYRSLALGVCITVVYIVIVGLFPFVYLHQPFHTDEMIFFVIGKHISHGATLYVDIADHKPPAIFYVAAWLWDLPGEPYVIGRILVFILYLITAGGVAILGRQIRNFAFGGAASLFFLVGVFLPHYAGYAFLTDPFCIVLMTGATIALFDDRAETDALAGGMLGLAVLFNQTVFLFGLPIMLLSALRLRFPRYRTSQYLMTVIYRYIVIGSGFVLPLGVVVAYAWSRGMLDAMLYYTFELPFFYYGLGPSVNLQPQFVSVGSYLPVWVLALGTVVITGRNLRSNQWVDERVVFLGLWFVVFAYQAMRAGRGHRYLFVMPAAALLATLAVSNLWRIGSDRLLPTTRTQWMTLGMGIISALVILVPLWGGILATPSIAPSETGDHRVVLIVPPIALLAALWFADLAGILKGQPFPATQRQWAAAGMALIVFLSMIGLMVGLNGIYMMLVTDNHIDQQAQHAATLDEDVDGQVYGLGPPNMYEVVYFNDTEPAGTWLSAPYAEPLAHDVVRTLERDQVEYVLIPRARVEDGQINTEQPLYPEPRRIVADYVEANYEPVERTEKVVVFRRQ